MRRMARRKVCPRERIPRIKIYWSDGADNHGASGANVGHADWVNREDYIYRYEIY